MYIRPLPKQPLLRWVLLIALLIGMALPLFVVLVGYPAFRSVLIHIHEEQAAQLANHLKTHLVDVDNILSRNEPMPNVYHFASSTLNDFGLLKFRIFDKHGRIHFSTKAGEVGIINDKPYFQQKIMKGERVSKLVPNAEYTLDGEQLRIDLVESYIPIKMQGRIIGAFEIYLNITENKARLDRTLAISIGIMIALALVLIIMLLILLKRASLDMQRHEADEQRIHEREARLAAIHAHSHNGIITINRKGLIVEFNPAAERLFGYKKKKMVGRHYQDALDAPQLTDQFDEALGPRKI